MMLLITSINAKDPDYDQCIQRHPCPHDNQDLKKLTDKERKAVMLCRIDRHIQCSLPEKDNHGQK